MKLTCYIHSLSQTPPPARVERSGMHREQHKFLSNRQHIAAVSDKYAITLRPEVEHIEC